MRVGKKKGTMRGLLEIEAQERKTNPHPLSRNTGIYLIFLCESGISQATNAVLLNFFISYEYCFVTQVFCDKPRYQKSRYKSDECNCQVISPTHVSHQFSSKLFRAHTLRRTHVTTVFLSTCLLLHGWHTWWGSLTSHERHKFTLDTVSVCFHWSR